MFERFQPEGVIAEAGHEADPSAEPRGHDGLIGAFAAEAKVEGPSRQRLARLRQTRGSEGQVHVRGADHADVCWFHG